MTYLDQLAEKYPSTPSMARLKAALLYAGVQYHPCLPEAVSWAFPNYMPHQLLPGEPAYKGQMKVAVPYMMVLDGTTHCRMRVKRDSPFRITPVEGDPTMFTLWEGERLVCPMSFEPRRAWTEALTASGVPMRSTGLSQHGDMLVLNVAPGCEYFLAPASKDPLGKGKTENLSCTFCLYGLPDKQRLEPLGQVIGKTELPQETLDRVTEACSHPETHARHLYLVGGSVLDIEQEGERYIQIARTLNAAGLHERYYIALGSGAITKAHMKTLRDLGVRGACYNMEVWDKAQFERVCPGKAKFIGRDRWITSLLEAAEIFGPNDVMTAMVGGAELEGEGAFETPEQAYESNMECGEYLTPRGVVPIYSLFWKVTGKNRGEEAFYTLDNFLRLNEGLAAIRAREQRFINPEFFCRRCAYMQLEPDYDEARPAEPQLSEHSRASLDSAMEG
ncbi:MAG: radical SAM protein [Bradymonadia bacterium]